MNRFPRVAALMCSFFAAGPIWSAPQADAVGTPGVVPHPIADYLPITIDKNMCLMCHRKASGSVAQKGEIPLSHFKAGKLSGERYECTLCHAPSAGSGELAPGDPNDAVH